MSIFRERGSKPPIYPDNDDTVFTLKIHHGGALAENDGIVSYVKGEVGFVDWVSRDYLSLLDLDDVAEKLGYGLPMNYFFKKQGEHNVDSYVQIKNDQELLTGLGIGKVSNVYFCVPIHPVAVDVSGDEYTFEDCEVPFEAFPTPTENEVRREEDNVEDKDEITDSEFEESDNEEVYVPRADNDPTKNWKEFDDIGEREHVPSGTEGSNELSSGSSEDENSETVGRTRGMSHREFDPKVDMADPQFQVGLVFPDANSLKKAIKEHGIRTHRPIKLMKNDKVRIRARCDDNCPWMLFASVVSGTKEGTASFMVKTLNLEHTCDTKYNSRQVTSKWLCDRYLSQWRANPKWSFAGFKQQVADDLQLDVTRWHYYRAKKWADKKIEGAVKDQYGKLWDYCEELRTSNPGSTVKMMCETDGDGEDAQNPKFKRLYICMAACKKGYIAGCRPVIGLDGCFVKGPHRGQLLAAVGIDSDNAIYPIAFAVVESECYDTWDWFLGFLTDDLNMNNSNNITWMSDRQKGLIEAVKKHFGDATHRFCVRHLYNNFKVTHKGLLLKQLLWSIARSTTQQRFKEEMEKLKGHSVEAWEWMSKIDPKQWSRAYFSEYPRCDILLNNLCESFNGAIIDARDKPIITLVEMVRCYIMKRLEAKLASVSKWKNPVGPRVWKLLENNKKTSRYCQAIYAGDLAFQVKTFDGSQYVVDLRTKKCACNRWALCGVPCCHAIACILQRGLNVYDFVHESLTKTTYERIYSHTIRPINGPALWPKTGHKPVNIPTFKKQRGRPKKLRRKEPEEYMAAGTNTKKLKRSYMKMSCKKCGASGHMAKTCGRGDGNQDAPNNQSV